MGYDNSEWSLGTCQGQKNIFAQRYIKWYFLFLTHFTEFLPKSEFEILNTRHYIFEKKSNCLFFNCSALGKLSDRKSNEMKAK